MIFTSIITYLILTCSQVSPTDFTIVPTTIAINALADYLWNINFLPIADRTTITLTFSNNVTLTSNSAVMYNSLLLTIIANGTNFITFDASSLAAAASASITVTNIRNPPMAKTSDYNFTLSSASQSNLQLEDYNSISYTNLQLSSCSWQFSLCTQQPNSQLTITISTLNPIYAGNNQILVGYAAVWANHNSKNLMFQVTTFTCTISFDGITYISLGVTCSNNADVNKITINFPLSATLPTASVIKIQINGVQSPPTSTTSISSSYFTATADSNGYLIDQFDGCTISPICVTNVTNGALTTSPLTVNQILTAQLINFISYPIITVLNSDTVWIEYSPQTNLVGCNVLKFWRNISNLKTLTPLNPANSTFIFPSDIFQIIDTLWPISFRLSCTAFIVPSSQASTPIKFHFYRANSQYLMLTANIVVSPAVLNLSTASLVLSNTEMAHNSTNYVFSFNSSQTLSSSSAIKINFPTDIDISGASCALTINGTPATVSCTVASSTLMMNISTSVNIAPSSRFQLTLSNVTNAGLPQLYSFNFTSYYNSSDGASTVESAAPAFNATFTTITSLVPTITPSAFSVYTTKQVNVTLTTPIALPANSNFTLTLPPQITLLSTNSQPLLVNGSQVTVSSLLINQTANSITFIKNTATSANSTLIIMTSFRSPPALGTYNYVNLAINNSAIYIQSINQLTINVNIPSTMPVAITANNPIAAQSSSYSVTVTYTVPHPAIFDLQIDIPSDTAYVTAPGTCAPGCAVTNFAANGSQVVITINNPNPNSSMIFSTTYVVSAFKNRRYVGTGTSFNFTTIAASQIVTQQSALLSISAPNLLVGQLDPNVFYTRANAAPVDLYLNLSVSLQDGDYFLATMDRNTYNSSSVLCSNYYGGCTVDALSTANVLIIKISPNVSSYSTNPLHITLQNLVSGQNTYYLQTDYITISHLCSAGLIETGKITYQISCGSALALPNQCRTCYGNGSCIDCYSASGYYLNNHVCVTSCGNATMYLSYADNVTSTCSACINNCLTCVNATACLSCVNTSFYLFTDSLICQLSCPLFNGYVAMAVGTQPTCVACSDPFCLHCTVVSYGSCTLCNNISTLSNGICLSSCPSISYYVLNSQCVICDTSCYSCFTAGNTGCLRCAAGYANNSGICMNGCPVGTAFVANLGSCGCDPACLTCNSQNYINCTSCTNVSYFVYLGQCIASCPSGSYKSSMNCLTCPTGCANCTGPSCSSCLAGWYFFNSSCYSDCNVISQQYDASGTNCVLCSDGCDTCSGGNCNSCVQSYTLSGSSCVLSCALSGSCPVDTSEIVPLPASITLLVWGALLLLLKVVSSTKAYIPYSLLTLSSVLEFIQLFISLLLLSQTTTARLLLAISQRNTAVRLFLGSLALNYVFNIIYVFVFCRYIKPLIVKPKQADAISHFVVMLIATLTNYRFGLLAYCKMCPKPSVRIDNSSRLTPVHYLCICSSILDLVIVIGCGLVLHSQQKWSLLFMLSLDLLILVIFNSLVTIWFVASNKSDEYYEDKTKYEAGDQNATHENLSNCNENDRDNSKIKIVAIEDGEEYGNRMQEVENVVLGSEQYKALRATKMKVSALKPAATNRTQKADQHQTLNSNEQSYSSGKIKQNQAAEVAEETTQQPSYDHSKDLFAKELEDADYEDSVPQKKFREVYGNSRVTSMRATPKPHQRYNQRYLHSRTSSNDGYRFDKELEEDTQNQHPPLSKNIFEQKVQEESDFPELEEVSVKPKKTDSAESTQKEKSLNINQSQIIRPVKREKVHIQREKNTMSSILPRGVLKPVEHKSVEEGPKTSQIYINESVGQKQKEESQLKQDDFQSIIRRKVVQSSIRKKYEINMFEEDGQLEDISPSKFNAANQRFRQDQRP